jgi:uncharacterized protein YdiU (UPF0061 family)
MNAPLERAAVVEPAGASMRWRSAARRTANFSEPQRLLRLLQRPFDEQPEHDADAGFAPDWARGLEVSCSS